MIGEIKRELIIENGVPVDVVNMYDGILSTTKALIGKASKPSMAEMSVEYYRKGQFLPEIKIDNGMIIENKITNESYLVVANLFEVVESQHIATITRLVETNGSITVGGYVQDADENGNITTKFEDKMKDVKVHIVPVNIEMLNTIPGLHPHTELRIYSPAFDMNELDQVVINVRGKEDKYKVLGLDYISFEGIVLIDVASETRK